MPKTDRRRALQVPRFTDSTELHGSQVVSGTIPAGGLDTGSLGDEIRRLGRVEAIDLRLTGPGGSFLHVGNIAYSGKETLHLEFAVEGGRRLFHMQGGDSPAITMGPAPVGGQSPLRVYADRMEVDVDVLVANEVARTFLRSGAIELTVGNVPYPEAQQGILIGASHGMESKRNGVRNILWDALAGNFRVGSDEQIVLDADGLIVNVDTSATPEYKGVQWRSASSPWASGKVGLLYCDGMGSAVGMVQQVWGITDNPEGQLVLAATSYYAAYKAQISLWAGPPGGPNEEQYGISLSPPMGYPVYVYGDLVVRMGKVLAGLSEQAPGSFTPIIGRLCTKFMGGYPTEDDKRSMRNGELLVAASGAEARLYARVVDRVYWWEASGSEEVA